MKGKTFTCTTPGCGGVLSIPYENHCVRGARAALYIDTVETGGRPVFRNVKYAPRRGLAGHVGYISPDRVLGGGQRWGRCPKCEAELDGLCNNCRPAARRWGE